MRNSLLLICIFIFSLSIQAQVEQANLLGTWKGDNILGSAAFDNAYNEIWGLAVNNREFAVIGTTEGTHFIDVTDPSNPVEVQLVEGAVSGPAIIHRDYHDKGCYLYAVADEPTSANAINKSTLQIMDISNLPGEVTVVYDSEELLFRSHNIFIDEPNDRLYAFIANGDNLGFSAMRIYDISVPENPQFLALHNELGGVNIQQVHDGYVKDHISYLNLGPGGFAIVDFTDAVNPTVLGSLDNYPEQGYNHSGWLSQDGQYYYMADENWGLRMKVIDVSDPSDLEVINFIDAGNTAPTSIPHNQIVACDYLYVSYYYDGLQVYNISDPANPIRIAEYDTSREPDAQSYKGAWGVYPFLPSGNILVSDMQEGLFVFESIDKTECAQRRSMCQDISNTEVIHDDKTFSISPNPANEQIVITSKAEFADHVEVIITDLTGKRVLEKQFKGEQSLNIHFPNNLSAGLYIVSIHSNTAVYSQKLVIE